MPKKARYDRETRYAVGELDGQEIYMSEFLMAKELGYLAKFQGHSELKEYMKLIPYLFATKTFDAIYKNIHDNRIIYALNESSRKIFHVVDENSFLVSVFIVSKRNFEKQLERRFELITNLSGGAATSHILSPARPFWRHSSLIERLYQDLEEKSITQGEKYGI